MFFLPRVITPTRSQLGCLAHQPPAVKSGALKIRPIEVSPAPSAPWHFEHFCLYRASVEAKTPTEEETAHVWLRAAWLRVNKFTVRRIPPATRINFRRSFIVSSGTFNKKKKDGVV